MSWQNIPPEAAKTYLVANQLDEVGEFLQVISPWEREHLLLLV